MTLDYIDEYLVNIVNDPESSIPIKFYAYYSDLKKENVCFSRKINLFWLNIKSYRYCYGLIFFQTFSEVFFIRILFVLCMKMIDLFNNIVFFFRRSRTRVKLK